MKYKLLKQIEEKDSIKVGSIFDIGDHRTTLDIDSPECQVPISFLISQGYIEEVKEPKTIYDLKEGDNYWYMDASGCIIRDKIVNYIEYDKISCFLTEREAKRNKLLRELATRTDKWLPSRGEPYITYTIYKPTYTYTIDWVGSNCDIVLYHMGLVFRGEKEYDKWITEENKKLLFEI